MAPRVFSSNTSLDRSEPTRNGGTHDRFSRHSNIMGHKQIELASIETKLVDEDQPPKTRRISIRRGDA
jgi:hypothetical protein